MNSIEGISQVMQNLEKLSFEIQERVGNALEKGGLLIEGRAKELVRVKSGFLQGSITTVKIEWCIILIGTNCSYAIPQEYGTRYMSAKPYLGPAFEEFKEPIINMANNAFISACEAISI